MKYTTNILRFVFLQKYADIIILLLIAILLHGYFENCPKPAYEEKTRKRRNFTVYAKGALYCVSQIEMFLSR